MFEEPLQNEHLISFIQYFLTHEWLFVLYNDSPNRSTGKIPFQIVYGMKPRGVSELRDLEQTEFKSVGVEDFAVEM